MGSDDRDTEGRRARVRRLLIEPVEAWGMRFKKGADPDATARYLANLCDQVAYLPDEALRALASWLKRHGEGSARCFWPPLVSVVSVAEAYQPRPLEEVPGVASWFTSRAGAAARDEGRLVAEFLFWEKYKRPPMTDAERGAVVRKAASLDSDVRVIEDRVRRNVPLRDDEREMRAWYRGIEARANALVDAGEAKREKGVA